MVSRMMLDEASRALSTIPVADAVGYIQVPLQGRFLRMFGHEAVNRPAGERLRDLPDQVREHFIAGTGEHQGVKADVKVQERGHVARAARFTHGQGDLQQLAAQRLRSVFRGQFRSYGLDGGTEFGEGAQLGAAAFSGQPPTDDKRIEGIPAVRGEDPDANTLDGFHQSQ